MRKSINGGDTEARSYRSDGLPSAIETSTVLSVLEWLSSDDCHALDEPGLIAGLGTRLVQIGLPVDRLTLHLMTLHPEILARTLAWSPAEPVEVRDREHGVRAQLSASPVMKVMNSGEPMVVRAGDPQWPWEGIDVFAHRGLQQISIVPLNNMDGPVSAACFATKRPGGFSVTDLMAIERIRPALRNTCEIRVMRQAELSLLDTYIGPMTAQRILAGRIRQGDIETIEAALLLCDLKGFTELSNSLTADKVLQLLNAYFDMVVPAITRNGGEVLKFMGDAVMAFFPSADAAIASRQALAACALIFRQLSDFELYGRRIEATIGLHYGEVSYGNIGSGRRLDFTVIGPDVNLLSRIQGACAPMGEELLITDDLRRRAGSDARSVGRHGLKGFAEPIELFAPGTA
ncbi:adenylate/guanylate cyclase domain-containing protein [Rhizobium sp. Root1220]|uniref:adenylate/guanylate cyclase domain-containing protein n=1 Tax=Rhizobium sp. Root1220 TaxID=1736432 RepID=UPI0007023474|nr:adenylate/guanylate cyclase domain-containing protein [Rhizobium sp. Root1220]KQV73269.1 adenylate cyclase [Rhizobium sp. Root1220]